MAGKISNKDRWVTMNGRHLLIKKGETPEEAWERDSKEIAKSESDRRDKEIAEREANTKALTAEMNGESTKYSIENGKDGAYLVSKVGDKLMKSKIIDADDPEKARVKLTGRGLVYLKKDPNMLKLLNKKK